ncbi:MAG: hypothetical protein FE048_02790 [Thermoplasmata archaeon]|nr:MAG: hypothetical protein FE048_02790 [Thermoplasmata archaeon]
MKVSIISYLARKIAYFLFNRSQTPIKKRNIMPKKTKLLIQYTLVIENIRKMIIAITINKRPNLRVSTSTIPLPLAISHIASILLLKFFSMSFKLSYDKVASC